MSIPTIMITLDASLCEFINLSNMINITTRTMNIGINLLTDTKSIVAV